MGRTRPPSASLGVVVAVPPPCGFNLFLLLLLQSERTHSHTVIRGNLGLFFRDFVTLSTFTAEIPSSFMAQRGMRLVGGQKELTIPRDAIHLCPSSLPFPTLQIKSDKWILASGFYSRDAAGLNNYTGAPPSLLSVSPGKALINVKKSQEEMPA